MNSKSKDNFIVQGSILAFTSILVRLIGLAYRIPMTRTLGDEGMGYYDYAFEVYNMAFIISSYAMPMAVSKLVADRCARKEYRNSLKILKGALLIALVLGGLLTAAVLFGADLIAVKVYANPYVAIPLRVIAPTILICAVLGVLRGFFQGKKTMVPTAVSQLLEQIVNAVVSVVAATLLVRAHSASEKISAYGAAGGVLGTGSGAAFALVFIIFIFALNLPALRRQASKDKKEDTESYLSILYVIFGTILPVTLSQVLVRSNGLIAASMYNHVMASKGISREAFTSTYGIYSSKYLVLCNIVTGITSAITIAMVPSIVSSHSVGNMSEVKQKISSAMKFNLIISMPSFVGLAVLGGPILKLLFNDGSTDAAFVMFIGSIAVVLYTVSVLFNTIIQSIYKMMIPVYHSAVAIAIDVIVLYVCLKFTGNGLVSLVAGNLTLPVVVIILNYITLKKDINLKINWLKAVIIPAVSSLIMGLVILLLYKGLLKVTGNTIALFVTIMAGVIIFFLCLIIFKDIKEDELYQLPKGATIVRILKKLHVM